MGLNVEGHKNEGPLEEGCEPCGGCMEALGRGHAYKLSPALISNLYMYTVVTFSITFKLKLTHKLLLVQNIAKKFATSAKHRQNIYKWGLVLFVLSSRMQQYSPLSKQTLYEGDKIFF